MSQRKNKISIKVQSNSRGFLKHLFKFPNDFINFRWNDKSYEQRSKLKKFLNKLAKSYIFDLLGLIKIAKVKIGNNDLVFSYNKFLSIDGPYVIYLENPYALSHYSIRKTRTFFGRRKINNMLSDENLKAIICMSLSCKNLLINELSIPKDVEVSQIYPLVPDVNFEFTHISDKYDNEILSCLYISSDFNLKGGQELINVFNRIQNLKLNINLIIITPIDMLTEEDVTKIGNNELVHLMDFNQSTEELNKFYEQSHLYLNPTRQDSFPLVILEAMKYGNAIISTDLFAISEMVEDDLNGYLLEPKYRFYNKNKTPNEYVWNNRSKTINSNFIDTDLEESLFEKITLLYKNRKLLKQMGKNSFDLANKKQFNTVKIINEWKEVLYEITE